MEAVSGSGTNGLRPDHPLTVSPGCPWSLGEGGL